MASGIDRLCETPAGLERDPVFAPFLKMQAPAILWSPDTERALWWSPAACELVFALAPDGIVVPQSSLQNRLAVLAAGGASRAGVRLERLRVDVHGHAEMLTCACRTIMMPSGEGALLTAIVGRLVLGNPLPGSREPDRSSFSNPGAVAEKNGDKKTNANSSQPAQVSAPQQPAPEKIAFSGPSSYEVTLNAADPPVEEEAYEPQEDATSSARNSRRFIWETDGEGRFTYVSSDLGEVVGQEAASLNGQTWTDLVDQWVRDPDGLVAASFHRPETWSRQGIAWRLGKTGRAVLASLSATPVWDAKRAFAGFQGFGVLFTKQVGPWDSQDWDDSVDTVFEEHPSSTQGAFFANAFFRNFLTAPAAFKKTSDLAELEAGHSESVANDLRTETANAVEHDSNPPVDGVFNTLSGDASAQFLMQWSASIHENAEPALSEALETPRQSSEPPLTEEETATSPLEGEQQVSAVVLPPPAVSPIGGLPASLQSDVTLSALSETERQAFRDIARVLSAEDHGEVPEEPLSDENPSEREDSADSDVPLQGTVTESNKSESSEQNDDASGSPSVTQESEALNVRDPGQNLENFQDPDPSEDVNAVSNEEAASQGENSRYLEVSAALDAASDGVVIVDERGRVVSLNRRAQAVFGYANDEVVGHAATMLFSIHSQALVLDALAGARGEETTKFLSDHRDVEGALRQGGVIPLLLSVAHIASTPERRFCLVIRDITAWKKAEHSLTASRKAAEQASVRKSEFLAKVSHELRTPLSAMVAFAEVMLEERFGSIGNARYKDYLRDIHTTGAHALSLVTDLLDIARIEAGLLDLKPTGVSLNDVVTQCLAIVQPQADRAHVVLRNSLAADFPTVVVDERSLRQSCLNILSNAVTFTDAGGQVTISTAVTDRGEAALRVKDTGIGMSAAQIQAALEPLRQVSSNRSAKGTGLGLPLTKALIEANRGQLSMTSEPGEGTLVEILLPPTRVLNI